MKIPLFKPYIRKEEIDAVLRVLKSRKLSRGFEVEKFEKEFAKYTNKKYAIAVNSGTSGLHLAVRVVGWKNGDEVITTPFSYVASANSLLFEGVKPVFVDIDPLTLNIDINKIEEKITKKTKGILLVHALGLPVNFEKIKKIKEKFNLVIIEDACEAIGQPDDIFTVTKLGDVSVYGFHENKQLTTGGEGGMIVTDNPALAQKCWSMRDQGRSTKKDWVRSVILGFNFRMTEMQASFGRSQLKILNKILKKREEIAQKYSLLFTGMDKIITPDNLVKEKRSWFVYFVLFKKSSDRDIAHKSLSKSGISSNTNYFPPIYNFPMYKKDNKADYKNTEEISNKILALPTFYEMSDKQIKQVAGVIKEALK